MSDSKLAEKVGCSRKTIMRARHYLQIPSYASSIKALDILSRASK